MKLSIIIPIYNTAAYLERCLGSAFNQDLPFTDYEVIAVNDGSTDDSLSILRDYQKLHVNLVLIDQKNNGDAAARNKAIEVSRGAYITFLDSDDAISENTLTDIMHYIESNDLDMLYLNIELYDERGEYIEKTNAIGDLYIIKNGLNHPRRTFPATIYRRTLIGEDRFPLGILIGTDTVFNAKAHFAAEKVSYWDIPYYKYTQRANSLSKQKRSGKIYFEGFVKALRELHQFESMKSSGTVLERQYFDKINSIFITRIIEDNVIPHWDRTKYDLLIVLLKELSIEDSLKGLAPKYKYIDKSFFRFKYYQKYLEFKSTIYKRFFSKNKQC